LTERSSRRRLLSEGTPTSSGETISPDRPQNRSTASNVLNATNDFNTSDCSLGAINYPRHDPITKKAILDQIERQKQSIGDAHIKNVTNEEQDTPLRKRFRKSCTSIQEILLRWANSQDNLNELAPANICSAYYELQEEFGHQLKYLWTLKLKDDADKKVAEQSDEIKKLQTAKKERDKSVKRLQSRLVRKNQKIKSMQEALDKLERDEVFPPEAHAKLSEMLSRPALAFLRRIGRQASPRANTQEQFNDAERQFAISLHFYSPSAFKFISKMFKHSVPNEKTIRNWIRADSTDVGFNETALKYISLQAEKMKANNQDLLIALSVDDMSVRKLLEFDGKRITGYTNFGEKDDLTGKTVIDTDAEPANLAHVFMATAINSDFSLPCALFFIDSLNAPQRAELAHKCIVSIEKAGAQVLTLTFDGTTTNFAMANHLGADLSSTKDPKHFFTNPHDETRDVFIILDPSHMIKLVRNMFGAKNKTIYNSRGEEIKFSYILHLYELQNGIGLHFANKLSKTHLEFQNNKMKVSYAAQLLSASVADALEFLMKRGYQAFKDAAATIEFIRIFDQLFDRCNGKFAFGVGTKSPLGKKNFDEWSPFFDKATEYINGLQISINSKPKQTLLDTTSKTGFFGFIICMKSLSSIYKSLIEPDQNNGSLKYLLPYKLSQDHLEMFFGAIRQKGGWNSNPSCSNALAAYKALNLNVIMIHSDKSNVKNDGVLKSLFETQKPKQREDYKFDAELENYIFECLKNIEQVVNFGICFNAQSESIVNANETRLQNLIDFEHDYEMDEDGIVDIVGYISGFIARSYTAHNTCKDCLPVIRDLCKTVGLPGCGLIDQKNRPGAKYGLIRASQDVQKICIITDMCINEAKNKKGNFNKILGLNIPKKVAETLVPTQIFFTHREHFDSHYDTYLEELIFRISDRYISIVVNYMVKKANNEIVSLRHFRNKLTHWDGK
jgi:Transposase protein